MSRLKYHPDLSNIKDIDTFVKYGSQAISQLQDIVDGGIDFDLNIATQTLDVIFTSVNTEVMVSHILNRKGLKFIVADKSVACDVYHNSSRDNASQICLSCTVATTVTIILM